MTIVSYTTDCSVAAVAKQLSLRFLQGAERVALRVPRTPFCDAMIYADLIISANIVPTFQRIPEDNSDKLFFSKDTV